MATLLRIDSSPMAAGMSFSRELTAEFARAWESKNRNGRVITRDLSQTNLFPINEEWIGASFTPESGRSEAQRQILAVSEELIDEVNAADEIVIGVSMHNFTIPGTLKLWIDQVVRIGRTVAYESGKPVGQLRGKKVVVLVASGGVYPSGSAMNFVEPYLRAVLGFIGITDVQFLYSGGTSQSRYGVEREAILRPALESIRAYFEPIAA